MDKKNTVIGVAFLVAAFATLYVGQRLSPPPPPAPEIAPAQAPLPTAPNQAPSVPSAPVSSPNDAAFAALEIEHGDEETLVVENDHIVVEFTNYGGAISAVSFKDYSDSFGSDRPYVFNDLRVEPVLAITDVPGLGPNTAYELVSSNNGVIVFRAVLEGRLEVTRRYTVAASGSESDPYVIRHQTSLRDLSGTGAPQTIASLSLGTSALTSDSGWGQQYLAVMSWDGEDEIYTKPGELAGGGMLAAVGLKDGTPKSSVAKDGTVLWAAVTNQFFASVYAGDLPGIGTVTRRVELPPLPGSAKANQGITGVARFPVSAIEANGSAILAGDLYIGPKEYSRLKKLDDKQWKVMQFAPYFFSKIFLAGQVAPVLNLTMVWLYGFIPDWGVAIILMTLLLKLVTLPFTLAASRSAKKMAKLQPVMKEVREKYKDNPQKMQQETMAIFKEHKVNPMGGCIPILITMPLFIAFFSMLQGTPELRFESFLWTKDLSAADTVWTIWKFPINIMPILMGATMIYQMRLTPTPATDNMQVQMMKFMPIIFTIFCYNFPAALALYSTVNGVFTIIQQVIVNKTTKDEPVGVSAGSSAMTTATAAWNPKKGKGRGKKKK